MSDRSFRSDPWPNEEAPTASGKALSREQAQAVRAALRSPSPWVVVLMQAAAGAVGSALAWLLTGDRSVGLSAFYGAAVVVVPGALMARGMTSRISSVSPGTSAVSFMLWEFLKIAVSVAMLVLAPKLVQPMSWPALLVSLVLCVKVYWFALLWRRR